jgi:predicted enzyme related to lactoylglutathione lyase
MSLFKRINFDFIPVTDVERARNFYRDVLEFTVHTDNPYGKSRWVFMQIPGAETLLQFDLQPKVERTETPALILVTDDVDATIATLKTRGVSIRHEPQDAPWAPGTRWAMIDDSEGNLVLIQTVN